MPYFDHTETPDLGPDHVEGHYLTYHYEHGQWWATCFCGASFSVVECGDESGATWVELEQLSDGDEDYHLSAP